MKNDLTCAVARDLLPSYAEGLTSEETNRAVEAHLAACPACAAALAAMTGETPAAETAEQVREVDFLKTVKRKNGRRVALAILVTVVLFAAGLAASIFLVGQRVSYESVAYQVTEEEGRLRVGVMSVGSANALVGWEAELRDGAAYVSGRSVLVSALHRSGAATVEIPQEGLSRIYLCGELIWQDGLAVQYSTRRLYQAKTPYVGDASALRRITDQLPTPALWGNYTSELQTAQEPYRWTLHFSGSLADAETLSAEMPRYAALILALVGNLEEVGWTHADGAGNTRSGLVTRQEINALLPEWVAAYNTLHGTQWQPRADVKDYAASPAALQELCELCTFR